MVHPVVRVGCGFLWHCLVSAYPVLQMLNGFIVIVVLSLERKGFWNEMISQTARTSVFYVNVNRPCRSTAQYICKKKKFVSACSCLLVHLYILNSGCFERVFVVERRSLCMLQAVGG